MRSLITSKVISQDLEIVGIDPNVSSLRLGIKLTLLIWSWGFVLGLHLPFVEDNGGRGIQQPLYGYGFAYLMWKAIGSG